MQKRKKIRATVDGERIYIDPETYRYIYPKKRIRKFIYWLYTRFNHNLRGYRFNWQRWYLCKRYKVHDYNWGHKLPLEEFYKLDLPYGDNLQMICIYCGRLAIQDVIEGKVGGHIYNNKGEKV